MRKCSYKVNNLTAVVLFALTTVFSSLALSSPNTITFQSRIVQPDGLPLEAAAVTFRMSITDTVGSCVIFQEDFTNRNMSGSKGLINLSLGGGTKVFPVGPMVMTEVFNNFGSPTLNCLSGGSINAGATDRRKLVVQFNDGSGWQTVPAMDINSNPFALQAVSAHKLGDFPAADYLRTATIPTCGGGQALHFNGTSITCVSAGGGGSYSGITDATGVNTIDNTNFAQTWNWSTATTQNPMSISANALTTGSLFNLTTSNNSLNSTNGLLHVANTGTSTNGTVARIQSNSTAGSGLTVLANGNVGVGTTSPLATLDVRVGNIFNTNIWGAIAVSTNTGCDQIRLKGDGGNGKPSIDFAQGNCVPYDTSLYRNSANVLRTAGNLLVDGYVGIGSTNPQRLLHVNGPMRIEPSALPGGPAAGDIAVDSGDGNKLKIHNGTSWLTASSTANGTTNRIPKYTAANTLGDSAITDDGARITATRSIAAITNTVGAAAVDLNLSNTHTLNTVGGAAITITNPTNGGVYNIIVTDAVSRTYTFTGCTNSFYRPANAATTAATRTIYGLMTVDIGGGNWDCYITWSSGFAP